MKRASWLRGAAVAALLAVASPAMAQNLGVGVYAPEIPLDPFKWFAYAQGLAKKLSTSLGVPVQGFAYKSAGDFQRDLKAKRIQFAVVGGVQQSSRRAGKVLASAKLASRRYLQWTLMCKRRTHLAGLRGKVLQLPALGSLLERVVEFGLLGGNIDISRHFKLVRSPSLTSAAEAVRLGQAEAVFAPLKTEGLVPMLRRTISVPPPAFVLLDPKMDPEKVKKATAAVLAFRGDNKLLVGWRGAKPAQYDRFTRLAKRRPLRMIMTPTAALRLQHSDVIDAGPLELELPPLDRLYEIP